MSFKALAIALVVSTVAAGCVSTGTSGGASSLLAPVKNLIEGPGSQKTLISEVKAGPYEASVLALGEEKDLAQSQGRGLGLVRQDEIEVYLEQIRAKLVAVSGVTNVPGKVRILATPSLDASSTADGNLFVSMAWLNVVESEDEIAAIIAHELAHVLLRHHSSDIINHTQRRVESMSQVAILAKTVLEQATAVSKADGQILQNVQFAVELGEKVLLPAWNRRQETEADLLAIDLLTLANYSPVALADMLAKRHAWESSVNESDEAFQKRVAALAMNDMGAAVGAVASHFAEMLARAHPDTDKRMIDAGEYLDRHYGSLELIEVSDQSLKQLVKQKSVSKVLVNYDMAFSASILLKKGKISEAYILGKKSVKALSSHAYPNWIAAKAARAAGKDKEAIRYLNVAMASTEPTSDMYVELIQLEEATGKYNKALNLIETAEKKFGDSPDWLPDRIRLYRKMGRTNDMSKAILKCSFDHPQMKRRCAEASEDPKSKRKG